MNFCDFKCANLLCKSLFSGKMGKKSDLSEKEKNSIRVYMSQGTDTLQISKLLKRDHRTIQRYVKEGHSSRKKRPKTGVKGISKRDVNAIKRIVAKKPHLTSKRVFEEANLKNVPRSTRCRVLKNMGSVKKMSPKSPLNETQRKKRMEWAARYLKTDFSKVIFTDEARATLDGPDGWANGWVLNGQDTKVRFRRQQGGGGVMFWAGIVGDELVGPVKVPEGVKVDSEAYCNLLEEAFFPWFEKQSQAKQRALIFQQDNAPAHSSRFTANYLKTRGLKEANLMIWPPNSADLNPIENLWSIIKQEVYKDGCQFSSKEDLWRAVQEAAEAVPSSTIHKLTSSMDSRLLDVHTKKGKHINK